MLIAHWSVVPLPFREPRGVRLRLSKKHRGVPRYQPGMLYHINNYVRIQTQGITIILILQTVNIQM